MVFRPGTPPGLVGLLPLGTEAVMMSLHRGPAGLMHLFTFHVGRLAQFLAQGKSGIHVSLVLSQF